MLSNRPTRAASDTARSSRRVSGAPRQAARPRRDSAATKSRNAADFSSFERVHAQEAENGYAGKPERAASFFRKGEAGSWRGVLAAEQVEGIIADHREVMERFGYLDAAGEPVF